MVENKNYLEDISQIRTLMEQSSRFISLSGLSGIFAGTYALIGAFVAHYLITASSFSPESKSYLFAGSNLKMLLYIDAAVVFVLAIVSGIYFTTRKAKKQGLKTWDNTSRRMLLNLAIPLATGGAFCLLLLSKGMISMVAAAALIFYGLSLVNASKYTVRDIRFLGFIEIALGLTAGIVPGGSIMFLALGFGVFHIVYGVVMYIKYEK